VPPTRNAFVYVYRGDVDVGGTNVAAPRMAILANDGDGVSLRARTASRALLIAGEPLGEPIAQYGPFVMNTQDELVAAVREYQSGRFAA
jgi:redox-sensitive bicupin YhaK (pirin superfamily)